MASGPLTSRRRHVLFSPCRASYENDSQLPSHGGWTTEVMLLCAMLYVNSLRRPAWRDSDDTVCLQGKLQFPPTKLMLPPKDFTYDQYPPKSRTKKKK